eukprot:10732254-Alexandrium_andersonii.AAC.1
MACGMRHAALRQFALSCYSVFVMACASPGTLGANIARGARRPWLWLWVTAWPLCIQQVVLESEATLHAALAAQPLFHIRCCECFRALQR